MLPGWPAFHSGHTECPQLLAEGPGIKLGGGHILSAQQTGQYLWVAQLHYLATAAGPDVFLCIIGGQTLYLTALSVLNCWPKGLALNRVAGTV